MSRLIYVLLISILFHSSVHAQLSIDECGIDVPRTCSSGQDSEYFWGTTDCIPKPGSICQECSDGCIACSPNDKRSCQLCDTGYRLSPVSAIDVTDFELEYFQQCLPLSDSLAIPISTGLDDGHESSSGSFLVDTSTSTVSLNDGFIALFFRRLLLPTGVRIVNASIQVSPSGNFSDTTEAIIQIEATGNPSMISTRYGRDISRRSPIDEVIHWTIDEDWQENLVMTSPNLATLIQKLINQPSWSQSAQNLLFTISAPSSTREFNAAESGSGPTLFIDYEACPDACGTCDTFGNCTSCLTNSVLTQDGECVADCPSGFADVNGFCKACPEGCIKCAQNLQCQECQPGLVSDDKGKCQPEGQCAPGQYLSSENNCEDCSSPCVECFGANSNQCLSCDSGKVLQDGHCIDACWQGFFNETGYCASCHSTCSSCDGPTSSDCTSCASPSVSHSGQCKTSCPSGTTAQPMAGQIQCHACNSACKECYGTSSSQCLQCSGRRLLRVTQFSSVCDVTCSTGLFADFNVLECLPCGDNCRRCSSGDGLHCQDCALGSNTFLHDGVCASSCPPGTFGSAIVRDCVTCNDECETCDGPSESDCLTCPIGKFFQDGQCLSQCESGYYPVVDDDTMPTCMLCHADCLTCSGPDSTDCTSCRNSTYLRSDGKCVANCQPEGYSDDEDNTCKPCATPCLTCNGPHEDNCLSCDELGLPSSVLQDSTCVKECAPGYVINDLETQCLQCTSNCLTCSPDPDTCASCHSGLFLLNGECVDTCGEGFFEEYGSNVCTSCHSSCRTCEGPTSADCLSCDTFGLVVFEGECVPQCPDGYFEADGECRTCHSSCKKCIGGEQQDCSECWPGFHSVDGSCISNCPPRTHNATGTCLQCPVDCSSCTSDQRCTSCRGVKEFQLSGQCVDDCGDFKFGDGSDFECNSCHPTCLRCLGPDIDECTLCPDSHRLENGRCVSDCSPGFFGSLTEAFCAPCDDVCTTCAGTLSGDCVTCSGSWPLKLSATLVEQKSLFLPNVTNSVSFEDAATCVSKCPDGTYESWSDSSCKACHSTCATCLSDSSSSCLTCPSSRVLFNGQCLIQCPSKTYEDEKSHSCQECHPSCETCSGPSALQCTSCHPDLIYHPDKGCIPKCPEGFFPTVDNSECLPCQSPCQSCISADICTSCDSGYLFNGDCNSTCPDGFYIDPLFNLCRECPSGSVPPTEGQSQCQCSPIHFILINDELQSQFECVSQDVIASLLPSLKQPSPFVKYSFDLDYDKMDEVQAKKSLLNQIPSDLRNQIFGLALIQGSVHALFSVPDGTSAQRLSRDVLLSLTVDGKTATSTGSVYSIVNNLPVLTTTTQTTVFTSTTADGGQQTAAPEADNTAMIGGVAGGAGVLLIIAVIIFIVHHKRAKEAKEEQLRLNSISSASSQSSLHLSLKRRNSLRSQMSMSVASDEYSDTFFELPPTSGSALFATVSRVTRELPRNSVHLGKKLGAGAFGEVFKGTVDVSEVYKDKNLIVEEEEVKVAIKTLKLGADEEEKNEFLREAAIMGQFQHKNVLKLLGVVTKGEGNVLLVTELMSEGALEDFLKRIRPDQPMTARRLLKRFGKVFIKMALDVARGMAYLAHKKFVHRDLAARNVLVDYDGTCKIADFGLSADIGSGAHEVGHDAKIPIKWTAPESVASRRYNSTSDMWSYGIVLFEIWAFAQRPYGKWKNKKALREVRKGYRLPAPPGCPLAVYELMIDAWNVDPEVRPSFRACVRRLQTLQNMAQRNIRDVPLGSGSELQELQYKYRRLQEDGATIPGQISRSAMIEAIVEDATAEEDAGQLPGAVDDGTKDEGDYEGDYEEDDVDMWHVEVKDKDYDYEDDEIEELNPEEEQDA